MEEVYPSETSLIVPVDTALRCARLESLSLPHDKLTHVPTHFPAIYLAARDRTLSWVNTAKLMQWQIAILSASSRNALPLTACDKYLDVWRVTSCRDVWTAARKYRPSVTVLIILFCSGYMFRLFRQAIIRQYKKHAKNDLFCFPFCVFVLPNGCDEAKKKILEGFWQFRPKKKKRHF